MSKVHEYLDKDVLTLAKERMNYIIDNYDTIYVSFSGGKDSLVVMELLDMIYKERGIKEKVKVIHRDEEFLPDDVVDFVDSYVKSERFDFRYYCLQLKHFMYSLGVKKGYVKWDTRREHLRPMPEYAIYDNDNIYDQYTTDVYTTKDGKGRKIILTGVRADESLTRLQAIRKSGQKNHLLVQIAANKKSGIELGRPIYDWTEKDVFKFFMDHKIKYCDIYDNQVWSGSELRVASSTSVEACKRLTVLKKMSPKYFDQICQVFPELRLQERYGEEFQTNFDPSEYSKGWRGIFEYIEKNLSGEQRNIAVTRVKQCMSTRDKRMKEGKGKENIYGYPVLYVFETIVKGNFKRPIAPQLKARTKDFEYEGLKK